ncbi:MAG: hypothetical protein GY759_10065 [Chloroflexi bacterium]|nr:hypothetical protein [Chloroflexota bacterium]
MDVTIVRFETKIRNHESGEILRFLTVNLTDTHDAIICAFDQALGFEVDEYGEPTFVLSQDGVECIADSLAQFAEGLGQIGKYAEAASRFSDGNTGISSVSFRAVETTVTDSRQIDYRDYDNE